MKAVVWTGYGPPEVLQLQEVARPAPKDHELLIKIQATTVTAGDCEMRRLQLPLGFGLPMRFYAGLTRPKRLTILGQELAGEVVEAGQNVRHFQPGDRVYGATGFKLGGYAEYICLPEESDDGVLGHMPANMSYEEAAAVPFGGLEALHFLKKAGLRPGETVLINGAGGSIGTFGVQLARYFGAEVTAVDSGDKLDMLRALGAGRAIDYTSEDFTQSGERYDVIFDVIGKSPYAASVKALKPGGRYVLANPRYSTLFRGFFTSRSTDKQVITGTAARTRPDLDFLKELIEAGRLKTVIDRVYPLAQAAEAHRYVETGVKQGNLILRVAGD